MSENSDSAMIAFIPPRAEWVQQDLPHMTLVYAGAISEGPPDLFEALAFDTAMIALVTPPFSLLSLGVDQFGEGDERVNVLRLVPTPQLLATRRMVENRSKSQYTDYKPHVTIGPVNSTAVPIELPKSVFFDRIILQWGDKMLAFNLRGY